VSQTKPLSPYISPQAASSITPDQGRQAPTVSGAIEYTQYSPVVEPCGQHTITWALTFFEGSKSDTTTNIKPNNREFTILFTIY
jgi:hypothetical protein